ncbi:MULTISPECIES: FAD-binding oxidoreductase [Xanthomonas]|uniref:Decaprenylphosphoryl-beta-D-ribose oxidase n=1 Tax=Xanthomonas sacchari TaxID=56458 RepID=A0ABT3DW90_9XANT|nr:MULTISPECIES: FAD-binding oxidoreductase [Xanthomonas]KAA8920817.1 FAD-binding oxidoreductase [Xanthomonas sontii]MCW0372364.1 Decaprenylphosphoryl-beta-D-ribose oxidase [Xanthomonas sacchari]MCW0378495.1 Decaprenylphosphoryl-beta-D-ribose oxidase [Xanthomonas sacchari]MCW0399554.1 Decaprenylphosphoryl-beta-D-ribose oxidase [Xanthomonas sacchari]MCW0413432.1 Decaprenylphosphoryl-beta-D-ribose oxidase [Xanthomonas sacchari]
MTDTTGQSWGRYPRVEQRLHRLYDRNTPLPALREAALPHGNGRSYGDSCLNPGGTLYLTRGLDRFIAFDPATGILRCEAGVTLDEVIRLVLPQGWFLPVTPGTRYATVGGAIANDVHGKNHHRAGSFGNHLLAMELLRTDGSRHLLQAGHPSGLFEASVGGLGLTGIILWAELRLRRVPGPWLETECIRFQNLDEFFALSQASSSGYEYTVAWIDCLAKGKQMGRGHFLRSDHAPGDRRSEPRQGQRNMPLTPPFSMVNSLTLGAFNTAYYWRQPSIRKRYSAHYRSYFYPLDGIANWNRMYGPKGFLQHQCALPSETARDAVSALLTEISHSGSGSFLAVLKEFGNIPSLGLLSFPRPGTTLALDFPNTGQDVFRLLDRLDRVVAHAGGAIYPAKDARMSAEIFKSGFPAWQQFQRYVDPQLSSGLWRRVTEV